MESEAENTIPGERWRPVPGYEGLYEVSDYGRVYSVLRLDSLGRRRGGHMLRSRPNKDGHMLVGLWKDSQPWTAKVHVLVLTAFTGPRPPGREGCHGDGNPANNTLGNLRWDTTSANRRDAMRHGTWGPPPPRARRGEQNGTARLTESAVRDIRRRWVAGEHQHVLAAAYGISQSHVSRIVRGENWEHVA